MKRVSTSKVINIVLVVALVGVVVFGYFYFLKINPVDKLTDMTVAADAYTPYKFLFGVYGKGDFVLNKPEGVTFGDNKIWVADSGNKRVIAFDRNGSPLFSFGNKPNDKIKLVGPVGILVDNSRVFVVDIRLRNIVEYTLNGQLVGYFGEKNVPMPAALKKYGEMYVALDMAGPGLIFMDSQGKIVQRTFVGQGSQEGKLDYPQDIAVIGNRIYVTDSNNNRLQYTDNIKGPLKVVKVKEGSEFGYPYAIAANKNTLFIGSATGRQVKVYGTNLPLETRLTINSQDESGIGLGTPVSVAVDDISRVYVADVTHSRIMVYSNK